MVDYKKFMSVVSNVSGLTLISGGKPAVSNVFLGDSQDNVRFELGTLDSYKDLSLEFSWARGHLELYVTYTQGGISIQKFDFNENDSKVCSDYLSQLAGSIVSLQGKGLRLGGK